MISRSFGTFASFARSVRTESRVGVAVVAWSTRKVYSVRLRRGLGLSSTILRSKVDPPELHLRDQRPNVFLRRGVDHHERDPLTWDAVYNGGTDRHRFDEGERPEVLFSVDLDQSAAGSDRL